MAEEKSNHIECVNGDIKNHLRILYLYQLLMTESDEDHMLSTTQIREKMKEYHGIYMHRSDILPVGVRMGRKDPHHGTGRCPGGIP